MGTCFNKPAWPSWMALSTALTPAERTLSKAGQVAAGSTSPRHRRPTSPAAAGGGGAQPAAGAAARIAGSGRRRTRAGSWPGPGLGAIGQHGGQQLGQIIGRGRHRRGRGEGAAAGLPRADSRGRLSSSICAAIPAPINTTQPH